MLFSLSELSKDLLQIVLSNLSPEELAQFRLVCTHFNVAINSTKMDVLWQPFLNRLKAIEPVAGIFNIIASCEYKRGIPWRYDAFKSVFGSFNEVQLEEITSFKLRYQQGEFPLPNTLSEPLCSIVTPATSLRALEIRNQLLNDINAHLIRSRIDVSSTELQIYGLGLTRFPLSILQEPALKAFWLGLTDIYAYQNAIAILPDEFGLFCPKIKYMIFYQNCLKTLPDSIGNCQQLTELDCSDNQLESLPNGLRNCKALQLLLIYNNELKVLPDIIGECQSLRELSCYNNYLKTLPGALSKCLGLQRIYADKNRIKQIPRSLLACPILDELMLDVNKLIFIPEVFKDKFGSAWAQETLENQNVDEMLSEIALLYDPQNSKDYFALQERIDEYQKCHPDEDISALQEPIEQSQGYQDYCWQLMHHSSLLFSRIHQPIKHEITTQHEHDKRYGLVRLSL